MKLKIDEMPEKVTEDVTLSHFSALTHILQSLANQKSRCCDQSETFKFECARI